jgi:hypothetical protein
MSSNSGYGLFVTSITLETASHRVDQLHLHSVREFPPRLAGGNQQDHSGACAVGGCTDPAWGGRLAPAGRRLAVGGVGAAPALRGRWCCPGIGVRVRLWAFPVRRSCVFPVSCADRGGRAPADPHGASKRLRTRERPCSTRLRFSISGWCQRDGASLRVVNGRGRLRAVYGPPRVGPWLINGVPLPSVGRARRRCCSDGGRQRPPDGPAGSPHRDLRRRGVAPR